MNCCYCGDPSVSPSAATQKSCTRGASLQHITCFPQRALFWHTPAIFGCSQLPACTGVLPLLKAMQACQILIQIADVAGFTPTASVVQFSPSQPSLLLSKFLLPCTACMLVCYCYPVPPAREALPRVASTLAQAGPLIGPAPLVYLMCKFR